LIDFHCHIDLYPDPAAVLAEAEARGVYILAVTTTPKAWRGNRKIIGDRRRVRIGLGLHPELVAERHSEIALWEHLLPETKYVGEVGLDGSPAYRTSWDLQQKTLSRILWACADAGGKVISLHSRRAATAVLDAIEAQPKAGIAILHWFSGTQRELDRAIALGCWFSVGPAMLRSEAGQKLAAAMPPSRMLTETDAPFSAIAGKQLMPWDVSLAYPILANAWKCREEAVAGRIADNLRRLGTLL
jgi:TatD DNase family protein